MYKATEGSAVASGGNNHSHSTEAQVTAVKARAVGGYIREFVELDQAKPSLRDLVAKLEEVHGKQITDALIDPSTGDIRYVPDSKSGKKVVRIRVNGRMA